jgi:hypothetical protein
MLKTKRPDENRGVLFLTFSWLTRCLGNLRIGMQQRRAVFDPLCGRLNAEPRVEMRQVVSPHYVRNRRIEPARLAPQSKDVSVTSHWRRLDATTGASFDHRHFH